MQQKKLKQCTIKICKHFWRILQMPLINCEINHILTCSANCVIVYTNVANQGATFAITETKLYVPVKIRYQLKLMQNYCNN